MQREVWEYGMWIGNMECSSLYNAGYQNSAECDQNDKMDGLHIQGSQMHISIHGLTTPSLYTTISPFIFKLFLFPSLPLIGFVTHTGKSEFEYLT